MEEKRTVILLIFSVVYVAVGLIFIWKGKISKDENDNRLGYTAFFLGIALVLVYLGNLGG